MGVLWMQKTQLKSADTVLIRYYLYHTRFIRTFKWNTVDPRGLRGCKTTRVQSWRSERNYLMVGMQDTLCIKKWKSWCDDFLIIMTRKSFQGSYSFSTATDEGLIRIKVLLDGGSYLWIGKLEKPNIASFVHITQTLPWD